MQFYANAGLLNNVLLRNILRAEFLIHFAFTDLYGEKLGSHAFSTAGRWIQPEIAVGLYQHYNTF
jgi:hypothetical protein